MSDTPRTVAVCEKLIAWATKNPNATIGDVAKFIVETFTEDMAEVERELNEAQKTITEFREWSIGGVAASEWKNRAETAEAALADMEQVKDRWMFRCEKAEAKLTPSPDVAKIIEAVRSAELFEDGVSADLHCAGIVTLPAAYLAGRIDGIDELAADLSPALLSLSAQLGEKEAELAAFRAENTAKLAEIKRLMDEREGLKAERDKLLVMASRMADCINRCQDDDDCSDLAAAYDFRQEYPR